MSRFKNLRAQGLVEYVLLLLLTGFVAILGLSLSGVSLSEVYAKAVDGLKFNNVTASCGELARSSGDWQAFKDSFWRGGITPGDGGYRVCPLCGGLLPARLGSDYEIDLSGVGVENIRPTWNGYGLAFRSTYDKNGLNGYMFEVEQVNKNKPAVIYFSKWVNGKQIQPPLAAMDMPSSFDWTNPPDFRIKVEGDSFTAYLNGEPALTAKDSTYAAGGVGVVANQGTQLTFEDLVVKPIGCEEAAQ
ncbi:MAG: hypothetical protein LDL50_05905 [Chloroflexi bacterium]|nr:hypothetical protein [Chloroflexota bacterium]MCA2001803.1 hypothetical protein [Chloroflexota bacterium]